jgi:hypothetical protein
LSITNHKPTIENQKTKLKPKITLIKMKKIKAICSMLPYFVILILAGVGLHNIVAHNFCITTIDYAIHQNIKLPDTIRNQSDTNEPANFITGQLTATLGELCVFKLNDSTARADWTIVPPASYYVDSSGSSLIFATNTPATYTIIAAITVDNEPKVLTHVCNYGVSPNPNPSPPPNPQSLSEWVRQNIPESVSTEVESLASCFELTADAIDAGTIKTTAAALAIIRTSTQTKIDINIWQPFLDKLANKIDEQLKKQNDIKQLKLILYEIVEGLR